MAWWSRADPEVTRERELEKLQDATEHNLAMFGDRAAEQINVRGYMDTIYDSLGLNTENVLISEEVVAERQEAAATRQQRHSKRLRPHPWTERTVEPEPTAVG